MDRGGVGVGTRNGITRTPVRMSDVGPQVQEGESMTRTRIENTLRATQG